MLVNRQRRVFRLDEKSDAVDHLADVLDLLRLFVIDLDLKLALEIEKNVEAVKRVDIKSLEAALWLHTFYGDPFRGRDNFQNPLFNGLVWQCVDVSLGTLV